METLRDTCWTVKLVANNIQFYTDKLRKKKIQLDLPCLVINSSITRNKAAIKVFLLMAKIGGNSHSAKGKLRIDL